MEMTRFLAFVGLLLLGLCHCQGQTVDAEQECTPENCKLPNCFCQTKNPPLNLKPHQIPQMVTIAFDDELNEHYLGFYKRLFREDKKNPNGCPISTTFYVSGNDTITDFNDVREMYLAGHEIASHSISHRFPVQWWSSASYNQLKNEFVGQRTNLVKSSRIPADQIQGVRVPFLELPHDTHFRMVKGEGFKYDSSIVVPPAPGERSIPAWPYTMDFPIQQPNFCDKNCPLDTHPGVWQLPVNGLYGKNDRTCAFVDGIGCYADTTNTEEILQFFRRNFRRFYESNKAPFALNLHGRWFNRLDHRERQFRVDAMDLFIRELLRDYDDVFIISMSQVIQWIQNPTTLDKINSFQPWRKTCEGPKRNRVRPYYDRNSAPALSSGAFALFTVYVLYWIGSTMYFS